MQAKQSLENRDTRKTELNRRLDEIGWGLFLIMIGVIWIVPGAQLPHGTWLIGVAVIMLGLNAVRYLNGIKMSRFTIALGLLALAAGMGSRFGFNLLLFSRLLLPTGDDTIM